MKDGNTGLAILVAKKAGLFGSAFSSTSELAGLTGYSQQSISRKLRELESEGAISRKVSTSGMELALAEKGRKELESFYLELKEIYSARKKVSLKGKVTQGLGEGTYYTSIPQYRKQFASLFGFNVFPGTLNLETNPAERAAFTNSPPVKVSGFKTGQRTFGGIDCWPCTANGKVKAVAIIPNRTNHPANVIELVAAFSLRKKLGLENGASIELVRE